MIHQDYILRMIEQLVRFLAQIIFRKKAGNYEDAFDEVELAVKNILGLDYGLLDKLSADDILSFIKKDELYSGIKLLILGKLIKEAAEVKLLRDSGKVPINDYHKALTLMLEGILTNIYHEVDLSNFYGDIKELDELTGNYQLPDSIYFKLFKFYDGIKEYQNAENLLFELKENNYPGILNEGKMYYSKLQNLSDDALAELNIERKDIISRQEQFLN